MRCRSPSGEPTGASRAGRRRVDDPRLGHLRPAPHFPRWAEELGRGATVTGVAADLPADEREAFALLSALAVVAVPVFVDDVWWGFIGLEDCEREREWSAAETDALRAAAGLVAAAVGRERSARDLRRRDAILQAVSHAAESLVAEPSWHNAAGELLEQLGVAAATSRAYLFECAFRADGKRVASQRFEWVADGVAAQLANPELQDLCFEEAGLGRLEQVLCLNGLFAADVKDLPPLRADALRVPGDPFDRRGADLRRRACGGASSASTIARASGRGARRSSMRSARLRA